MTHINPVLPQQRGGLFLTDAGLETDFVFNHGYELPAFAAHTLLESAQGRAALESYFCRFLTLANDHDAGFILDAPTWRAQRYFAGALNVAPESLQAVNQDAVAFVRTLRARYASNIRPILLNGLIGPRGDAYAPEDYLSADAAMAYHAEQVAWLADAGVDMLSGLTITYAAEAIGIIRAAQGHQMPVVLSFTVETDGRLPSGQDLQAALAETDAATGGYAAYYMINCAHPDHFANQLDKSGWTKRIGGFRCNASCKSHAELDACETLDAGNPEALAAAYAELHALLPWANVFGGCCGTDLRHVTAIVKAIRSATPDGPRTGLVQEPDHV